MGTTIYSLVGGRPGKPSARVLVEARSARERTKARAEVHYRSRRAGGVIAPVPVFGITEAMCQTKARRAYCAARRAGADTDAANEAFEAQLARWRPLIGTPIDAFFASDDE